MREAPPAVAKADQGAATRARQRARQAAGAVQSQLPAVHKAVAAAVNSIVGSEVIFPLLHNRACYSQAMQDTLQLLNTPSSRCEACHTSRLNCWKARTLGVKPLDLLARQVADDQPLMEAGLDSLGSVDLRNILAAQFSVELPSTVTFDYPTIPALARFITSLLATQGAHSNFESAILPSILPSIDSVR